MSVLFTDSMTVYNYHRDANTGIETWSRSVIQGIQWRHGKKGIDVADGTITGSSVESITIDFNRSYENKPYVDASVYAKLLEEERAGYWTLNDLEGQDVLVHGSTDREIEKSYRIEDLIQDYPYAGIVVSLSDNRNRPRLRSIKAEVKR